MKKYEDIIHLSRPVSTKHPYVKGEPGGTVCAFAALTGFEGLLRRLPG